MNAELPEPSVTAAPPEVLTAREILVVDDSASNLQAIEAALSGMGFTLVLAQSGRAALKLLLDRPFALILLDVHMPGLDGFETARLVRQRERTRNVPIIFVTACRSDDVSVLDGYELGAVDFLFKPIRREVLRAKAQVFIELQRRAAEALEHAAALQESQQREHLRQLEEERRRWEAESLRREMAQERAVSARLALGDRRKNDFLAVLAHELRNPLATISPAIELLSGDALEPEARGGAWSAMRRQVRHLSRLVDDLLDVSRITRGKIEIRRERVDVAEAVAEAVEMMRAQVDERGQVLDVSLSTAPWPVVGDRVRLVQVFANLLANAVRYSSDGATIRVEGEVQGDQVRIAVQDTGRGIPPELLEEIFDLFVQEQAGSGGLGLGLPLVRRIVELHGGEVRGHSDGADQGSRFEVRLPLPDGLADGLSELAEPAASAVSATPAGEAVVRRVLVVDDDDDVRTMVAALLRAWGHEVDEVGDGLQAIAAMVERPPDVAVVDIGMPGLSGYEVATRVRAELGERAPKLVAMSGFGQAADKRRALAAGFDLHLTKPPEIDVLMDAIVAPRAPNA